MPPPRARRRLSTAALTLALLAGLTPAADAAGPGPASNTSVFRDGFETPVVAAGQFRRYPAGSHLGPWTVTRGDVDLATTRLWQVTEGRQNLDLDGAANGTIETTIPVRPLTTYRITYDLAGNPAAAPLVKTGEVRVNGKAVQRFTFDTGRTSLSRMAFTTGSVSVFSLTGSMRLEFASTTTPAGWGPVIDDVRVDSCLILLCPTGKAARV
jgi:choice-of-anchor C domain-containing protein